jgi:pimeloyl-ACP methyl ester carboxylesterase
MLSLEEWFGTGCHVRVALGAAAYRIYVRVEGEGPWLTFLHGFPTCSWDFAKVSGPLRASHRLLLFDFLGFGDSDKPRGHDYSLFEQADLTEALWRHWGVTETGLVAHDYGDTVALELLARQKEGRLAARVDRAFFMNGGVYVDLQRPILAQKLLQKPVLGDLLTRLMGERAFAQQFGSVFSKRYPATREELRQHWAAVQRHGGVRNYPRLIRYLAERRAHRARWEAALEDAGAPMHFLWGLADPVSGRPIAERLRERVRAASLRALEDVGHYPQLEVPEIAVEEMERAFASA